MVAGLVRTSGIIVIRRFEMWGRQNLSYFGCFAPGVPFEVSFLRFIPSSFTMGARAPMPLFAGYLFMPSFNRLLTAYASDKPVTAKYTLGRVLLVGIGFHSFLDGIACPASFSVSVLTSGLAAFGMVLHEFLEGIVTYALLLRSGFSA